MSDPAQVAASRSALRSKIFAPRELKSKVITFMDAEIEVRQPCLGQIMSARDEENKQTALVKILVEYAYVPGTDEKIFEMADEEAFMQLPWSNDFLAVNKAIEELTEINVAGK